MKKHFALLVLAGCVISIGCTLQQHFTKTPRETDATYCAAYAVVPNNYDTPEKRAHFINDIAVPACLRAKGYDVKVGE